MNPYLMGAGSALEALNGVANYQMQNRMYNRDKQQANRMESQQLLAAMNDQRNRANKSQGNAYLLKQMAQRLGLGDMPITMSRELMIKPMSGTTRVDQQFQNYYGMGKPAQPPVPLRPASGVSPSNPNAILRLIAPLLGQMGGR